MFKQSISYICKDSKTLDLQLQRLFHAYSLKKIDTQQIERVWLDSFDWRLYARGQALTAEQFSPGQVAMTLYSLVTGEVLTRIVTDQIPRFPADLPNNRLRALIETPLFPRCLLPQLRVQVDRSHWQLLNQEQKILLRVNGENQRIPSTDPQAAETLAILELRPLRGYAAAAQPLLHSLENQPGLKPIEFRELFEQTFSQAGKQPGDYSSGFKVPLKATLRTDEAVRKILLTLLDTIEKNLPGTRQDLDSEFLHDLRVATRRSRSVLSGIKKVFPAASLGHFKSELKWFFSATSRSRDLDVYLLAIDDYQAALPTQLAKHLEALRSYLQQEKQQEHARLLKVLESERLRAFLKDWRDYLSTPPDAAMQTKVGKKPIAATAGAATWTTYEKVIADGNTLTHDSPAEEFHALRKDAKKLRYLMELFASIYPKKRWKTLLKIQKKLQNILGDFQDLQVQADQMIDIGKQMSENFTCQPETLMAMGMLAHQLVERQRHALDHFESIFGELASKEVRQAYHALCVERPKELHS